MSKHKDLVLPEIVLAYKRRAAAQTQGDRDVGIPEQKQRKRRRGGNRGNNLESFGSEVAADPAAVPTGYNEGCTAALKSPGMARLRKLELLRYDTGEFGFQTAIKAAFETACPNIVEMPLDKLHNLAGPDFKPESSFKEMKRRLVERNGLELNAHLRIPYERFIEDFVAPHVRDLMAPEYTMRKMIFQAVPSIRVQQPSSMPIGHAHCDAMYKHQCGQVNFWLPLTTASGNNSLWSESAPGANDFEPFACEYGEVVRFWGHRCVHMTVPNDTDVTRVSLDFRIVPGPCFEVDPPEARQATGRTMFAIGGYYRECTFDIASNRWQVDSLFSAKHDGGDENAG